jgi:hypothetical protein
MSPKKLRKIPRRNVSLYVHEGYEDNRGKLHKTKFVARVSSFFNFVGGLLNILFNKNARRKPTN